MEKVRDVPLRKAFVLCVSVTLLCAVILSALTIWVCVAVQNWLMPEKEQAVLSLNAQCADGSWEKKMTIVLTKGDNLPFLVSTDEGNEERTISYSFDKVQKSYKSLSPKRKTVYIAAGIAMIALPMLYSVAGILMCAVWFYKRKLKEPLQVLETATSHIAKQDLDFAISYNSKDEFGKLCTSFERMRVELLKANREMWGMLEERQKLHASIAHDLRNPIAIIKGYVEYLQIHAQKGDLKPEQTQMIAGNLAASADRLERYTDSVRSISQLEALEIHRSSCQVLRFLNCVAEDMQILAQKSGIELNISNTAPEMEILLDTQSYSRVLENILQNALRFAKSTVCLFWRLGDGVLTTTVTDDGPGFPEEVLNRQKHTVYSQQPKHRGLGLVISDILCRRHGGRLNLQNTKTGARVDFDFRVQ